MKIILWISLYLPFLAFSTIERPTIRVHALYTEDPKSQHSIHTISFRNYKPIRENESINVGYNLSTAVWCKIELTNNLNKDQRFWLVFDNNRLDSIQLFDKNTTQILGDRTSSIGRFMNIPAFQIDMAAKSKREFLIRIKKGLSFMDFSFHLEKNISIQKRTNHTFFLLSLILGMIVFLLLFTSTLFAINKKRLYLIYIFYTLLSTTYILIATGFAKFILLPNFLFFSEGLIYFGTIWFIMLFIFLANFLQLKRFDPKLYRIISGIIGLTCLYVILSLTLYLTGHFKWLKIFAILNYINFVLLIFTTILAGFRHLKINKSNAIYVLVSFIPHFIWSLSIIMKAFGLTSKDLHVNWLVLLSIYDILLFGFVLVQYYFETFQTNLRLSEQIIKSKEDLIDSITTTQIIERQNIAHLIHDKFGYTIGHILQLLETEDKKTVRAELYDFSLNIRNVSHQIMPKSLEDGALYDGLKMQLEILNTSMGHCPISMKEYDFPVKIEFKMAQNLYLIFLELINNARKHSDATQIHIEFYGYPDCLVLQCSDNGKGFELSTTKKGFGLNSIESRVELMHGTLSIETAIQNGTLVQLVLPRKEVNKNY